MRGRHAALSLLLFLLLILAVLQRPGPTAAVHPPAGPLPRTSGRWRPAAAEPVASGGALRLGRATRLHGNCSACATQRRTADAHVRGSAFVLDLVGAKGKILNTWLGTHLPFPCHFKCYVFSATFLSPQFNFVRLPWPLNPLVSKETRFFISLDLGEQEQLAGQSHGCLPWPHSLPVSSARLGLTTMPGT